MSERTDNGGQSTPGTGPQKGREHPTKSATVQKLLKRGKGATLAEITGATQWQAHSARAFLTGLRKKGLVLLKECRTDGETTWRIDG